MQAVFSDDCTAQRLPSGRYAHLFSPLLDDGYLNLACYTFLIPVFLPAAIDVCDYSNLQERILHQDLMAGYCSVLCNAPL